MAVEFIKDLWPLGWHCQLPCLQQVVAQADFQMIHKSGERVAKTDENNAGVEINGEQQPRFSSGVDHRVTP